MNKSIGKAKPTHNPVKQKIQLGVLGVLILIALIVGGVQLQQSKASSTAQNKTAQPLLSKSVTTRPLQPAIAADGQKQLATNTDPWIEQSVTWPMTLRRDPFVWSRLNAPVPQVTLTAPDHQAINAQARASLKLQGVMFDQNPRVLVNGVLLQLGSEVSGFEIKQIEKRAMIVTRQGVDVRISL